ncbi:hypothetical protein I35_1284 [Burkholderia cenocepacia H111]|nr:hypothetical protein I35_1284 [Burkholderia cenocepacia H111]
MRGACDARSVGAVQDCRRARALDAGHGRSCPRLARPARVLDRGGLGRDARPRAAAAVSAGAGSRRCGTRFVSNRDRRLFAALARTWATTGGRRRLAALDRALADLGWIDAAKAAHARRARARRGRCAGRRAGGDRAVARRRDRDRGVADRLAMGGAGAPRSCSMGFLQRLVRMRGGYVLRMGAVGRPFHTAGADSRP